MAESTGKHVEKTPPAQEPSETCRSANTGLKFGIAPFLGFLIAAALFMLAMFAGILLSHPSYPRLRMPRSGLMFVLWMIEGLALLSAIPAIILSVAALGKIQRASLSARKNWRIAVIGLILGCIYLIVALLITSRIYLWLLDRWRLPFIRLASQDFLYYAILSGVFLTLFFGVLVIIQGRVVESRIRKNAMAMLSSLVIGGRILGYISVAVAMLAAACFGFLSMQHNCRYCSNESSDIGNLRTITGAQTGYKAAHGVYASSFAELTDDTHGPVFLLGQWGNIAKSGYIYTLKSIDNGNCYEATASPATQGRGGGRSFFTDCTGVIRFNNTRPANLTDKPIGP